jgi:PIN domain nuclease of toxin-antitoxin system
VKYLLDTHAAIWLLEGSPKLGRRAREALASEDKESVGISDITLLEVAMLSHSGRIHLSPDTRRGVAAIARQLTVFPIDALVAAEAAASKLPQRDPFDRVIVATARAHRLTLVTKDHTIAKSKTVPTLW